MSCTICAQSTLPGAMLCRACKAALKRARNLTVQDVPRPTQHRGPRPRRNAAGPAAHPTVSNDPLRRSFWRDIAVASVTLALVGVAAYAGQGILDASEREAAIPLAGEAPAVALQVPAIIERPATGRPAASAPAPAPAIDTSTAHSTSFAEPDASAAPLAARTLVDAPRARSASRADAVAVPAIVAPPVEASPVVTTVEPLAAPIAPPAPAPDRWQLMRDELAACEREGGLSGVVCDQRTRLARCEGYWGRVSACPLPPENPGGQ